MQQTNLPNDGYVVNVSSNEELPPPKPDFLAPPPYEVATKLPTYEEVQREKNLQGEPTHPSQPSVDRSAGQPLAFFAIDTDTNDEVDTGLLGTDFMFFTAFFGKTVIISSRLDFIVVIFQLHLFSIGLDFYY